MITVTIDDLAFVAADAVVRPADQALDPVTPATVRLDRAAGERFAILRRVSTPLAAGAAVVTGGGELNAPFVLHVVIRDQENPGGRETVRRALVSAWQRAAEWDLAVVAAPLVGAGAGQLGPEEAAGLLCETFAAREPGSAPRELRIVVEQPEEEAQVAAVVRRLAP